MTGRLLHLIPLLVAGCAVGAATDDTGPVEDTDSGTQIGGIDCEYDKLELTVEDEAGTPRASEVSVTFPNSDVLTESCAESGCQLELGGAGTYTVAVSTQAHGSAVQTVVLDESNEAGQLSADCGDRPFHEVDLTVVVSPDDGGGDILTSNLGLRAFASDGNQVGGSATITSSTETWTRSCRATRCWIDIFGPDTFAISFVGDNGETGNTSVIVSATDKVGVNELGDDVYEREVRVDLR